MAIDYRFDLSKKTRHMDPRIKKMDLFSLCHDQYINQKYNNCQCRIDPPSFCSFDSKYPINAGLGIRHEVLSKNVMQMKGDYGLTYSETRQFDTKHNLFKLNIEVEFLLGEKVEISAFRKSYGVIFQASHYKVSEIDD